MSEKKDIQLSLSAYTKILCHVMQYPYTAVNGILLTKEGCEDKEQVEVVDCVPLFHYNIPISPMFIVALTQIEEYASNRDMKICGYYHANEYYSDSEVGAVATRIADKIAENCEDCCLLIVENDKLSALNTDIPIKAFLPSKTNDRIDWRSSDKPLLQFGEKGLQMGPEVVKKQLYRSIIDMDCHYDDVSLHWDNRAIDEVVKLFVESLTEH
ncbi:ER membrane protein complex subunit 9-like [Bolinopsis microptera]|uniref:ER membrane protein complex subunit 9-like n=1 Tax=Bolinopsis microptera TaxID=2820187 RepID=UPI00307A5BAE